MSNGFWGSLNLVILERKSRGKGYSVAQCFPLILSLSPAPVQVFHCGISWNCEGLDMTPSASSTKIILGVRQSITRAPVEFCSYSTLFGTLLKILA